MVRPDSESWKQNKALGDAAEMAVARLASQLGFRALRTIGADDADLQVQALVEVKNDKRALETGNVAVEVARRGAPSGLCASGATIWAVVIGETVYVCQTWRLRDMIDKGSYQRVQAGDNKYTQCVLVPLEDLQAQRWVLKLRVPNEVDRE